MARRGIPGSRHGRTREKHSRARLVGKLTLVQCYSSDAMLTIVQIGKWLGLDDCSVRRYALANPMPSPDGMPTGEGSRGGAKKRGMAYKGKPAWRPHTVLRWLDTAGRLGD